MPRTFIVLLACLLLFGCSSPAKRAQALFNQGKYEEVISQYPDAPAAHAARDTLAVREQAKQKEPDWIGIDGPTPSSNEPNNRAAEMLFNRKQYDSVLTYYPNTPAANMARNALAEQLYNNRKIDELVQKYPNTPWGMKIRNDWAEARWRIIRDLPKKKRIPAIEEFLKDRRYTGTDAVARAKVHLDWLMRQ